MEQIANREDLRALILRDIAWHRTKLSRLIWAHLGLVFILLGMGGLLLTFSFPPLFLIPIGLTLVSVEYLFHQAENRHLGLLEKLYEMGNILAQHPSEWVRLRKRYLNTRK